MFEDWTPREKAALKRATAWLRAYSSLKTDLRNCENPAFHPITRAEKADSPRIIRAKNNPPLLRSKHLNNAPRGDNPKK